MCWLVMKNLFITLGNGKKMSESQWYRGEMNNPAGSWLRSGSDSG